MPGLGDDEAGVVVVVDEVRSREVFCVDATREPEEVVLRVLECRRIGSIGVEAADDFRAGEFAGWK